MHLWRLSQFMSSRSCLVIPNLQNTDLWFWFLQNDFSFRFRFSLSYWNRFLDTLDINKADGSNRVQYSFWNWVSSQNFCHVLETMSNEYPERDSQGKFYNTGIYGPWVPRCYSWLNFQLRKSFWNWSEKLPTLTNRQMLTFLIQCWKKNQSFWNISFGKITVECAMSFQTGTCARNVVANQVRSHTAFHKIIL